MRTLSPALMAAFTIATCGHVYAQDNYPSQPLRLIIPFGPGGATDNVARQISEKLGKELNTSVVVENRPGAAGNIALDTAARSKPDGYTMLLGNVSTNAINKWVYGDKIHSDPLKDLVPVTLVATVPGVFASSGKFPPNNLQELGAYAKKHPGEVNHASAGSGSYAMIDMLNFEQIAGLQLVHVPFKGGAGQYIVSMVANEVQISLTNASSVLQLVKGGKLKALAVTGEKRLDDFPGVPTMAEAGFKGVGTSGWQGVFAPAGTPKSVINKVHRSINIVLDDPGLRASFKRMLIEPTGSASPEEFADFVENESEKWEKLVKKFNLAAE